MSMALKYRMKQKKHRDAAKKHGDSAKEMMVGEGYRENHKAAHAGKLAEMAEESEKPIMSEARKERITDNLIRHGKALGKNGAYADGGEVEEAPPEGSSFSKSTGKKISDSFMGETPECEHGSKECEMCHGGMYAKGGKVKHPSKGVHDSSTSLGSSNAGGLAEVGKKLRAHGDKARVYGEEHAGDNATEYSKKLHREKLSELKEMRKDDRKYLAEGGQVSTDHDSEGLDMIDHIMQQRAMSKGGQVANDTGDGESADEMENQFDYLVTNDDLNADYTGANSGDELGDAQEDDDRADVVSMIMRSRKKKDRLPSPR